MSLEAKWKALKPSTKRNSVLALAGTIIISIFIAYAATGTPTPEKRSFSAEKPEVTLLMGKETKDVTTEVLQARITSLESVMAQFEKKFSSLDLKSGQPTNQIQSQPVLPYEGGSDLVTLPGTPILKADNTRGAPRTNQPAPIIPEQSTLNPGNLKASSIPQNQLQPIPHINPQADKPTVDLTPSNATQDTKPFSVESYNNDSSIQSQESTPQQPPKSRIRGFSLSEQSTEPSSIASTDKDTTKDQSQSSGFKNTSLPISMTPREKVNQAIKNTNSALKQQEIKQSFYLPRGTIFTGVLLTGLDAPTGPNAKSEPLPALYRVKDLAVLPNKAQLDISECFILLSAYGDLSSERAHMRAESLSCITNDGKVIDTQIDAFASGDDGKAGIRGRVVSKAGSVIAKATLGAFISGISNIFMPSRVRALQIDPTSTEQFQVPDPKFATIQGAMSGARTAASQIQDYYLKTAESIFPIIEIDAGRQIDFIVSKGASLQPKTQSEMASQPSGLQTSSPFGNKQSQPFSRTPSQAISGAASSAINRTPAGAALNSLMNPTQ